MISGKSENMKIGGYSYEEYLGLVKSFHGATAPGVILGGFMVELAKNDIPEGVLFEAVSETRSCLPDAIQLLTPCTIGNGWLKVLNMGRYALSLYDKYSGEGTRVFVDPKKLHAWPELEAWLFKLKSKAEQDLETLLDEIRRAGTGVLSVEPVRIRSSYLKKQGKGGIGNCPLCGEPYPARDGAICRACQGEAPYELQRKGPVDRDETRDGPPLKVVPVGEAVGMKTLHDMTMIIPGKSKEAVFTRGQQISAGDLCRLQQMGRRRVYVEEEGRQFDEWVHEDEAARVLAGAMAGEGVGLAAPPKEGKINLSAARDGLFTADVERLERFNMVAGVICACRKSYSVVNSGRVLAGTRAIPLFLPREDFREAMTVLRDGPLFSVLPIRRARVGILVTGSEVFEGIVEDRFIPIISAKVEALGCEVVRSTIVPDERQAIRDGIKGLIENGIDLLVTTAGLSVDPDDVTRLGLLDAGASDMLYGAPVLPGAMILLARIGSVQVMGVPACALYFKTTSFDRLLPRRLAGLEITRRDLAKLGHGSLCLECKVCTFPKCPFGG